MCGIVGFVRPWAAAHEDETCLEEAAPLASVLAEDRFCGKQFLYEGLRQLTYRGYDSCGIAVIYELPGGGTKIALQKTAGKVDRLKSMLEFLPDDAAAGVGHTRWATHGPPTSMNAHPHRHRGLALVHNGIVENSDALRSQLTQATFLSDTDSEVALWTVHRLLDEGLSMEQALLKLAEILTGSFTMVLMMGAQPERLFIIKQGSPLVVGFGDQGSFCASDVSAMESVAQQVLFLEDGDVGILSPDNFKFLAGPGHVQRGHDPVFLRDPSMVGLTILSPGGGDAGKGEYPHYMYKEIREQPEVLARIVSRFVDGATQTMSGKELGMMAVDMDRVTHIHFVGCGSAYYASQLGAMAMEAYGVIPCRVSQASEYRYGAPVITPQTLMIAVSQSGETADTIGCVRYALKFDAQVLALCNVSYSSLCRLATSSVLMNAQKEVGVASTKAFTAQVLCLLFMACYVHQRRGFPVLKGLLAELHRLSAAVGQIFELEEQIKEWSQQVSGQKSCLFIGRHTHAAIASEGALKLKEISYLHAEAYPAGELKHGPLALVDAQMMMIAMAPQDEHYPKMLSNIEEVCARGARVLAITTAEDPQLRSLCHDLLVIPYLTTPYLQSILTAVVLQLTAYYSAVLLGHDVDQPRNLAKSVTVE